MLIFLIGLPSSGKSTLGRLLAKQLNWQFVDTDDVIMANNQGREIYEIFKRGELYFRSCEHNALKQAIRNYDNAIISTGGGICDTESNIKLLRENGLNIYLKVSVKELFKRCQKTRPWMKLSDLEAKNIKRSPLYEKVADRIIDCTDLKKQCIVDRIVKITKGEE